MRWLEFTDHDHVVALIPEDRIASMVITVAAEHRDQDPRGRFPAGHVVAVTQLGQEGDPITNLIIDPAVWASLIGDEPFKPTWVVEGRPTLTNGHPRCMAFVQCGRIFNHNGPHGLT